MAETLPETAAGWAALTVQEAQDAFERTMSGGTRAADAAAAAERMALVSRTVGGCIEVILWEALRLADPLAADMLAADVAELCDTGDSFGELLYEWQQRLAQGLPLSGSTVYNDLWQRAGLAVPAYGVATDG